MTSIVDEVAAFAQPGDRVTCENGHHIGTVIKPLYEAGKSDANSIRWDIDPPPPRGRVRRDAYACPECGQLYMLPEHQGYHGLLIHVEDGWKPDGEFWRSLYPQIGDGPTDAPKT